MPWQVKQNGNQYCIYNKDTGKLVAGSCKSTRAACMPQLKALYANVPEARRMSENAINTLLVDVKAFADAVQVDDPVWIHYAPFGQWDHPEYGMTIMTPGKAEKMVKNFKERVRGIDTLIDFDHGFDKAKGGRASGEIVDMQVRPDGVWSAVKFTDTAKEEIGKGEWRYFSPMFYEKWKHPHTNVVHEAVPAGGGLTNKPWIKGMVPLNFSEVVLEQVGKKFKLEDDKFLVSEDGGNEWRPATTDEVAELEHSEPGTGSPPLPRLDEDDRSGDKDGRGQRRDTPPPEPDRPLNSNEEGSRVKLKKEVLEALELNSDEEGEVEDSLVEEAVLAMFSEVVPLRKLKKETDDAKTFAEQFPEEYERMQHLQSRDNEFAAKTFAEKYGRRVEGEGDEAKAGKVGLSALALTSVQDMAKAFADGTADLKMFGELMDTLNTDKAFVDYGEHGSSRVDDTTVEIPEGGKQAIARAFSEKIEEVKNEALNDGKVLAHGDAVAAAAKKHPDLWKAYNEAPTPTA